MELPAQWPRLSRRQHPAFRRRDRRRANDYGGKDAPAPADSATWKIVG